MAYGRRSHGECEGSEEGVGIKSISPDGGEGSWQGDRSELLVVLKSTRPDGCEGSQARQVKRSEVVELKSH